MDTTHVRRSAPPRQSANLSKETAFELLSDRRRRYVLHALLREEGVATLGELTTRLERWETDTDSAEENIAQENIAEEDYAVVAGGLTGAVAAALRAGPLLYPVIAGVGYVLSGGLNPFAAVGLVSLASLLGFVHRLRRFEGLER